MKEKFINWLNETRYNSHIIRLLAGGYVTYLGGSIIYDRFTGGDVSTAPFICAIALALVGAAIALIGLYAVVKGYSLEYQGRSPWAPPLEDEEEETAALSDEELSTEEESE